MRLTKIMALASVRTIPSKIVTLEDLNMPDVLKGCHHAKGAYSDRTHGVGEIDYLGGDH